MKEDDMNGGGSSDNSSTATADATGTASPGPMCVSADDDAAEGPEAQGAEGPQAEAAGEGGEGGGAPCAEATHLPLVVLQRDGNSCRWVGLPPL
eukprot:scaffold43850_cov49-Phaeocystis_antarctica.AAC.1